MESTIAAALLVLSHKRGLLPHSSVKFALYSQRNGPSRRHDFCSKTSHVASRGIPRMIRRYTILLHRAQIADPSPPEYGSATDHSHRLCYLMEPPPPPRRALSEAGSTANLAAHS